MDSDTKAMILIFGVIVVGLAAIIGIAYILTAKTCLDSYEHYHPQFGLFTGCRIEYNGVLTPTDIIRKI